MKHLFGYTLLIMLLGLPALAGDEAQRLYDSAQYENAIRKYDRILSEHPDWEEAHFGRGAALYKAEQINEAMREFELAIPSKNPRQKSAAFYNLGNALLKSQRLEESLRFYKRALELNSRDYDAKHNFELARQMLQQEQQQQQQNQDQQNQEQQEQQQQQNQPGQQNQQPEQKQEQQKQESQPQQQPQQQKREQEKSQEEAAQVLDALKDTEKEMMQERMKTKYSGMKKEKDW